MRARGALPQIWRMSPIRTALVAALLPLSACSPSPTQMIESAPPALAELYLSGPVGPEAPRLKVMRVAHASVLLDFGGRTVLTDPWFSEKTSFRPGEPVGVSIDQLPRLSAVVASHAHYDHFDIETFGRYPHKDVPFLVGPGMVEAARKAGFTRVRELKPGESAHVDGLTITAAPGKHGVEEVTFLIASNHFSVYFAADTLLSPEVRFFAKEAGPVDLVLPAVNGLRAVGRQVVMNAEEAGELAKLIQARAAIPTHYRFKGSWFTETFFLRYDGTPERFVAAVAKQSPKTQTRVLTTGQWLTIVK